MYTECFTYFNEILSNLDYYSCSHLCFLWNAISEYAPKEEPGKLLWICRRELLLACLGFDILDTTENLEYGGLPVERNSRSHIAVFSCSGKPKKGEFTWYLLQLRGTVWVGERKWKSLFESFDCIPLYPFVTVCCVLWITVCEWA